MFQPIGKILNNILGYMGRFIIFFRRRLLVVSFLVPHKLNGYILFAPSARPLEDLVVEQLVYIASLNPLAVSTFEKVKQDYDRLKKGTLFINMDVT